MNINTWRAFSEANRLRCVSPEGFNHALDRWSLSDWITAVVGELGEAANLAKKLNRIRDGIPGNKESEAELRYKLRREIADAYIYLDLIAQSQGFLLDEAVIETFNRKSADVGYPVELKLAPPAPRVTLDNVRRLLAVVMVRYLYDKGHPLIGALEGLKWLSGEESAFTGPLLETELQAYADDALPSIRAVVANTLNPPAPEDAHAK